MLFEGVGVDEEGGSGGVGGGGEICDQVSQNSVDLMQKGMPA